MITWGELLSEALIDNGETWDDVVSNTMSEEQMAAEFDYGFGAVEGCAFTVWTKRRVYFPVEYDGSESIGSVSRDPDGKPTNHV